MIQPKHIGRPLHTRDSKDTQDCLGSYKLHMESSVVVAGELLLRKVIFWPQGFGGLRCRGLGYFWKFYLLYKIACLYAA
jgi:hypothetical protein